MNRLKAVIESVKSQGSLSMISLQAGNISLKTIVIDTPETLDYLQKGHEVQVLFKETEIFLGKGNLENLSLQNRIPATIESIETGRLLSRISMTCTEGSIQAVITSDAVEQLQLSSGDEVTAMIKTNEIMLSR